MSSPHTISSSMEGKDPRPPVHLGDNPDPSLNSALNDVPDDVLLAFFKAALDHKGFPSVTISHVSRRWRELAITTPALWSKIVIAPDVEGHPRHLDVNDPAALPTEDMALRDEKEKGWKEGLERIPRRVAVYLHRSENSPLHLSLKTSERRYSEYASDVEQLHKSLVQLLQPSSPRWESVDLDISVQDFSSPLLPLLQITPDRMSNVRSLRMTAEWRIDIECAMYFFPMDVQSPHMGTPLASTVGALRSASLASLEIVSTAAQAIGKLPAPWAMLNHLSIGSGGVPRLFTQLDALKIMLNCPNLVDCSLEFHEVCDLCFPMDFLPPQPLPNQLVTLPNLRSLNLSGENPNAQGLPSRLTLPSLASLSIDHSNHAYPRDAARSPQVEWVKEYGNQLSNVTLDYSSLAPSALLYCLQGIPNVVNLRLLGTPSVVEEEGGLDISHRTRGAAVIDDDLVSRFTPGFDGGDGHAEVEACLCPRLRRFECRMGSTEQSEGAFLKMALARYGDGTKRMRGSVRRIEEVVLSYNRPRSVDIEKELKECGVDTFRLALKTSYIY